ncbi:MAG TPA: GYD domain-containing protein [Xanthobacteraceae bacterium]|nr:GYD domain-containing protein [Xanthobacteraceae bacterium]
MAIYVTLVNFTEQGVRNIKDTIKRTDAAKQAGAAVGVKIREVLWTQGQYDMVIISESDDEIAANAMILNAVKGGNIRTQVMRAFTAAEMQKIIDKVQ